MGHLDVTFKQNDTWQKCPEYIYIHWPFCKNKCHYCDFISFEKHEEFIKNYHEALCLQIKKFSEKFSSKNIKTIFIGGGTPSLYPLYLLEELFDNIKQNFNLEKTEEVTIEVNPRDVKEEHLNVYQKLGINRLSIGVQILDDKVLEKLNRKQNKEDVFNLIKIAPKYFDNISVDLMLGLPDVLKKVWQNTLKEVISWPIKHISVYLLMVYEKTPLYFKVEKGELNLGEDSKIASLYEDTVNFLRDSGFEQYEISNFAKQGFESIHNKAYWDRRPYKGFGLGASSFDGSNRFVNEKNLIRYINSCNSSSDEPIFFSEKLTKKQEILETLMLGLRQNKGMNLHSVLYFLSRGEREMFMASLEELKSQSLIKEIGGNIALTLKGMLLENEVILKLF